MLSSVPVYLSCLTAAIAAAVISMYSVRKIMFITRHRKIYDIPDDTRKIHGPGIPSLGGIGIFIGYVTVAVLCWPEHQLYINFILPASVILFTVGIYDDLMNMRPSKKLLAQLIASFIAVYFADIRITSFYGIFEIGELPYWVSVAITTLGCTFFINVFNFIDGIDGLACISAILYTGLLGVLFAQSGYYGIAWVAFSLAGATIGLLYYNIAPAKIYMGDTGSMMVGFTIFVLSVLFVKLVGENTTQVASSIHTAQGAFLIVLSMLFLPIYDAIRVFILRASRGISPLKADRTHLHYYLLDAGFTHSQSVCIIISANLALIVITWLLQDANSYLILAGMALFASALLYCIYRLRSKHIGETNKTLVV